MACSNPIQLRSNTFKIPSKSHMSFDKLARLRSLGENNYINIPCNWCLNCRIDKQSQLIDRCEYEYIKYGCGAFVTFTYDDVHLFKNSFIDSHTGKTISTINKKDGKDFLNRLNKLVHQESDRLAKLKLPDTLCNKNYKYVCSYEYGDQFNRPHIHCLFFGLDFAYCKRLFWKAWKYKGSIQVGAIKNGGIAYATKYISEQTFGTDSFYKYDYHHLTRPTSTHSIGLGQGLFESQKDFIKKTGCYKWHNEVRPCPKYIKDKYHVICDLNPEVIRKNFINKCKNIKEMYNVEIKTFNDLQKFSINKASIKQRNIAIKLQQKGKKVYDSDLIAKERFLLKYNSNRLPNTFDTEPIYIINKNYNIFPKYIPDNKRYSDIVPF